MIPNAAGTALEDENAARRILRAPPPAAGPFARILVTKWGKDAVRWVLIGPRMHFDDFRWIMVHPLDSSLNRC